MYHLHAFSGHLAMYASFWFPTTAYVVFILAVSVSVTFIISLCLWFHQKKRWVLR